jgi:V8-like Glu-specific endopeptidase
VIIVGHAIYEVPGTPSYALIYQPNETSSDYVNNIILGNVNITGDFAFVPYQNITPQLLYITQDNSPRPIQLYINTTVRWNELTQTFVYKTGQNTSTTSGYIQNWTLLCIFRSNETGNIYIHTYCIYTDVPVLPGDSGAPLCKYGAGRDGRPWVGLYGHLCGVTSGNLSVFISVEAIYQSNFTPLTAGREHELSTL